jgi:hypothetical protein
VGVEAASEKLMIKNVLSSIGGIGMYGVISVCLFFLIFSGAVFWAGLLRRSYLNRMSYLPLEDESKRDGGTGYE